MDYTLAKIKKIIRQGRYRFTFKARAERHADGLITEDIIESLLNARHIEKKINSSNPITGSKEKLYIIKSFSNQEILVYTKGKIIQEDR